MNPNHVVSLELSKQLKEAGYKQEGIFWWNDQGLGHGHIGLFRPDMSDYVLPLASDLMERLPIGITVGMDDKHRYFISYLSEVIFDDTLCNACAKMWLYLRKEGLLR